MARGPGLLNTTLRTPSISAAPITASCLEWQMARTADPQILDTGIKAHVDGRWVVRMPLLGQDGVIGHRPARADATPAQTFGAE
jgi:hypothetical protein